MRIKEGGQGGIIGRKRNAAKSESQNRHSEKHAQQHKERFPILFSYSQQFLPIPKPDSLIH